MQIQFICLAAFLFEKTSAVVQLTEFFGFGAEYDNYVLPSGDTITSARIYFPTPLYFYGKLRDFATVHVDGYISFVSGSIAPFYDDIDTSKSGNVYWKQATTDEYLQKASSEIGSAFPAHCNITLKWILVATWRSVPKYGMTPCCDHLNTFQATLTTDGIHSFVIFYYNDITWFSDRSWTGFSLGNYKYTIDGSGTDDMTTLEHRSNMGSPGKWIFRVDKPKIYEQVSLCNLPPQPANGYCRATDYIPESIAECGCLPDYHQTKPNTSILRCSYADSGIAHWQGEEIICVSNSEVSLILEIIFIGIMGNALSIQPNTTARNPPNILLIRLFDVLSFFNRQDLESVSISSKFVRQIVLRHFCNKPYSIIDAYFNVRVHRSYVRDSYNVALVREYGADGYQYFDVNAANWDGDFEGNMPDECWIDFERMRPYFHSWLRIKITIVDFHPWVGASGLMKRCESVCHLWDTQQLLLTVDENLLDARFSRISQMFGSLSAKNGSAIEKFLTNPKLLRCHELDYRAWNYVSQVHKFPLIYEIDVIRITVMDQLNVESAVKMIESKGFHSNSTTVFVVDREDEGQENVTPKILELIATLYVNFVHSTTPCRYLVVFLNCSTNNDLSIENNATEEVLLSRNGGGENFYHRDEFPGPTFTLVRTAL
ncbi:nidogen-like domain-containing protein [Ditylenchus destructor]|nr:nidogen-like domain-containing protein [Ditylenchus destructor]